MPGGLLQPVVPGATSIGQVIAQATAAATAQSAQILSAARNIAADRQRAGEMAADAVVRMRLEDFQKEQFRQKQSIENARLGIALAANQRAEAREPLERQLLQAEIDQAPLRTALIGAQLTGAQLGNTVTADRLLHLPEERELLRDREERLQRRDDVVFDTARLDYLEAQKGFDDATRAEMDTKTLADLMTNTDLADEESLTYALQLLDGMRDPESKTTVLTDPRVAELFNSAVEKLGTDEEMKESLRIPEAVIDALRPQTTTSMGLRQDVEKRMRIDADRDAKISKAEAKIKIAKSQKEAFKGLTSKEAKNSVRLLDEKIQAAEQEKIDAETDFQEKLKSLNPGLIMPAGDGTPTPELVTPKTEAEKMDYLSRGLN